MWLINRALDAIVDRQLELAEWAFARGAVIFSDAANRLDDVAEWCRFLASATRTAP